MLIRSPLRYINENRNEKEDENIKFLSLIIQLEVKRKIFKLKEIKSKMLARTTRTIREDAKVFRIE